MQPEFIDGEMVRKGRMRHAFVSFVGECFPPKKVLSFSLFLACTRPVIRVLKIHPKITSNAHIY